MGSPSFSTYAIIALIAGIGIPIMAAMNSHLGERLSSPAAASLVLFFVAGMSSLIAFLLFGSLPKNLFLAAPPVFYFAGLLVAFYVLSITWIAPRFGIGNAIFFVLLGQLISAAIIDHFGLFGAQVVTIDLKRTFGLILMTAGVFMAARVV